MMYIENIFVLLAAPLVACILCVSGRSRIMVASMLAGMTACLLSAYVNAFFTQLVGGDAITGAVEIAPTVEETMKLLPLLFYLLVLEPETEDVNLAFVFVAVGFATMESAFYLADNGVAYPGTLALRGLSTAMMHIACGVVMGYGLVRMWDHAWLRLAGGFALLCLTMIFHALYNLFVAIGGAATIAAVAMPLCTLAVLLAFSHRRKAAEKRE